MEKLEELSARARELEHQLFGVRGEIRAEISRILDVTATVALTTREAEVLDLVRLGMCNKEIAAKLNFSERTAKFHVSNLLVKYNVRDRFGLCGIGGR